MKKMPTDRSGLVPAVHVLRRVRVSLRVHDMESNLPPPSTTNLLLLTYPQVSQKYAYLFQYILILILASPYFDGIHRGLTLVPWRRNRRCSRPAGRRRPSPS